jgi:putative holliday junction resolvase
LSPILPETLDKSLEIMDRFCMRIMGLDVGSHTIGVALSDELGLTAQGLETIRRKSMDQDLQELARIVTKYQVSKIVVGLPKNMDGTLGPQAEKMLEWKRTLEENLALPVVTWDERLTTVGATRILLEADVSRKKRKKSVDKIAAMLILQGYLDVSREHRDDVSFTG